LGVNATTYMWVGRGIFTPMFQSAPTLGGECYFLYGSSRPSNALKFQWAPTLGGECYSNKYARLWAMFWVNSFNGHPPLGVNATASSTLRHDLTSSVSMGTHPWG